MNGALVDTSYLITLSISSRGNHLTAKNYYQTCLEKRIPLYLSSIAVSEFTVIQDLSELPMSNFRQLPFTTEHGVRAGELTALGLEHRAGAQRTTAKDDIKLLAQCLSQGISHFLTDDDKCVSKIGTLRRLLSTRNLPHGVACSAPFDVRWFDPAGQNPLSFG